MDLEQAYKAVYDDLIKCELLTGKYDATNGEEHYMYGISTVMEIIAYRADKTGVLHDLFEDMFLNNMMKSEEKSNNLRQSRK